MTRPIMAIAGLLASVTFFGASSAQRAASPFPSIAACKEREIALTAQVDTAEQAMLKMVKASAERVKAEAKVKRLWSQIANVDTKCLQLELDEASAPSSKKSLDDNAAALARMTGASKSVGGSRDNAASLSRMTGRGGAAAGSTSANLTEAEKRRASEARWATSERLRLDNERRAREAAQAEAQRLEQQQRYASLAAERELQEEQAARSGSGSALLDTIGGIVASSLAQTARNMASGRTGRSAPPTYGGYGSRSAQSSSAASGTASLETQCPGLLAAIERVSAGIAPSDTSGGICSTMRLSIAAQRRSANLLRQCSHRYAIESLRDIEHTTADSVRAGAAANCGPL